ncbi:DUF222 domain-containing protein [Candidatus Poriferisocius sp.]|uniref:HNH endonuclease signature motif containing protein n=1 Tax=Candidatus Poriferisocius sp. TaxID=3101276 RepID=UPI003B0189B8
MEFTLNPSTSGANGAAAGFAFPDYSEAGASELLGLMGEADLLRRRAEGYLVGLVARYGELEGPGAAATVCHQFGISAYQARRLAKTAESLTAMPQILGAVQDGHISADQGAVVAESHKRAPMSAQDQQELLDLGGWQGHDEFKKSVVAREDQRRADNGMGRAERQRARRSAKVFDGSGGMVVLHAELDQESGERVKIALGSMSTKMLGDDIAYDPIRTFEQRNADALVALITQQPTNADEDSAGAPDCGIRPQKTVLVVAADYDAIEGRLKNAGLIDGTPIELDELRRLACEAQIVPMIFGSDGQALYMGRAQRAVTKAQKLALYRRDRGCVGCGIRPQACDAHHIQPWDHNGPTDMDNLVLLCPRCHTKAHKHGHILERDAETGRHRLLPPPRPSPTIHPPPLQIPPRQHQTAA